MDQGILAFLSNLLQNPYMDYLNDPFSQMGLTGMMQQQTQQPFSEFDLTRLLEMARGIDPRASIPTRSVGSIFQPAPMNAPNRADAGFIPQNTGLAGSINRTGLPTGMPARSQAGEVYSGDFFNRAPRERQQLSGVGGIFPATLKDYYTSIFSGRNTIAR